MYFDHHKVDDTLFSALRAHFTDDEVLELSWAIGEFISLGKIIWVLDVPYGDCAHAGAGSQDAPA